MTTQSDGMLFTTNIDKPTTELLKFDEVKRYTFIRQYKPREITLLDAKYDLDQINYLVRYDELSDEDREVFLIDNVYLLSPRFLQNLAKNFETNRAILILVILKKYDDVYKAIGSIKYRHIGEKVHDIKSSIVSEIQSMMHGGQANVPIDYFFTVTGLSAVYEGDFGKVCSASLYKYTNGTKELLKVLRTPSHSVRFVFPERKEKRVKKKDEQVKIEKSAHIGRTRTTRLSTPDSSSSSGLF